MIKLIDILNEYKINNPSKKYKLKIVEPDQTTDGEYGAIINNKYCSDNVKNDSYEPFEWLVDVSDDDENDNSMVITIMGKGFETWEQEEEDEYLENEWDQYVEENKGSFLKDIAYKTEEDHYNPISIKYYLIED
jgi:hypothetical protein